MTNVLILGANGRIARFVVAALSKQSDIAQTLLVRDAAKLAEVPDNARVITADVLDTAALTDAVSGQDIVYANLTGDDIDEQAKSVVAAMDSAGVSRLVFVLALGILNVDVGALVVAFGAGEQAPQILGQPLRFRRLRRVVHIVCHVLPPGFVVVVQSDYGDGYVIRPRCLTSIDDSKWTRPKMTH